MMWKPLLLKCGVLVCAAALAVTLNLQNSLGTTDAQILGRTAFQWDVRHPPVISPPTMVPLHLSEYRLTDHHTTTTQTFSSPTVIDVNDADVGALAQLPGIGVTLAQRIVNFRSIRGPFETMTTLMLIKGIGPKRFALIEPCLSISAQ